MKVEVAKCENAKDEDICRSCKRSEKKTETEEFATFNLKKTLNGFICDGYVSKRESKGLF